jgi:hypothetical protein
MRGDVENPNNGKKQPKNRNMLVVSRETESRHGSLDMFLGVAVVGKMGITDQQMSAYRREGGAA